MQLKDFLSYIVIVPILIYSVIEGFAVIDGVKTLSAEYPECYQKHPYRDYIFLGTLLLFSLTATPTERASEALFLKILPDRKFPKDSKVRITKAKVMAERTFRLFVYTIFTVVAYIILYQGNFVTIFLLGGPVVSPKYYKNYPC